MTVAEYIEYLRQLDPNTQVVRYIHGEYIAKWYSMDGWYPQLRDLIEMRGPGKAVYYREASGRSNEKIVTALEI